MGFLPFFTKNNERKNSIFSRARFFVFGKLQWLLGGLTNELTFLPSTDTTRISSTNVYPSKLNSSSTGPERARPISAARKISSPIVSFCDSFARSLIIGPLAQRRDLARPAAIPCRGTLGLVVEHLSGVLDVARIARSLGPYVVLPKPRVSIFGKLDHRDLPRRFESLPAPARAIARGKERTGPQRRRVLGELGPQRLGLSNRDPQRPGPPINDRNAIRLLRLVANVNDAAIGTMAVVEIEHVGLRESGQTLE